MSKKISIILNSYNPTQQQAHMTMACLAAIRKFTEPPYELIVVDNAISGVTHAIRDEYKVLNLDDEIYIHNPDNQTVYYSYDQGAKAATGDYFVFIQSDVFVHEKTINKLVRYLERFDVAFPQQVPISREDVEKIYGVADGEDTHIGGRDAGMIAITREAYKKCGGWDVRFKNLLGEKAFFIRWDRAGLSWTCQTNALITHIMAGNNLLKDGGLYANEMDYDAQLIMEEYDGNHIT